MFLNKIVLFLYACYKNRRLALNLYHHVKLQSTAESGYNDIGLCDTSSIASDILWYRLISRC